MTKRILALVLCLVFAGCSSTPKGTTKEEVRFFGETKVHRFKLANGLKVLLLEDPSAPTFAYQTWFDVGSKDETKGLTGLAHLFEHMMFKGTSTHPDGEFLRLLESAGSEGENAFTDRDYTGYVENLPKTHLELVIKLESDRMVNLKIDDEALAKEREVVQNERRLRKENNPDGQLFELVHEMAFTKHPYQWPVIGYEEDLNRATRKDCENFYRRFYAPNNATVVVVGDIDPSATIDLIAKHYGPLPASPIERNRPLKEPSQTEERRQTVRLKVGVEKLLVAYHVPDVNSIEVPVLEVLRNILAGNKSSRLYKKLVDAGVATNVDIINPDRSNPGLFLFFVNLQKNQRAEKALAIIDSELKRIANSKVTPIEIERAISLHRFSLVNGLGSNQSKAQFLGYYETIAGHFERGIEIVDALRAIDKFALSKVVQNRFKKQNRSVVIALPQGK
ncbi:MAG: pitrilysin family protein [Bdellovibrionota bacterium]